MDKRTNLIKDCIIIIPAFNEEDSIAHVLNDIPSERVIQTIVVNNNSTDKTKEVAEMNGAIIVDENQQGYGKACLSGISKAIEFDPKIIVFLDGDYSDNPGEMTSLLHKIDEGYELVIGSRTLGKAEKGALLPQAIFGNWLATFLMRLLFKGYKFTDLGPFRAIKLDSLLSLNMKDEDFGWTVEMQAKALLKQLKCTEVSVSYRKRIGISKITGTLKGTILAGYKILGTISFLYISNLFRTQSTKSN